MGREIRRVPKGWEHPKDERGEYRPLNDEDYESAAQEWIDGFLAWENGTDPNRAKYGGHYWDYAGSPPEDESYYRSAWTAEEATHYQIYETVSEGTPTSPVFDSLEALDDWLVEQGYSEEAAAAFAKGGYAPSMVMVGGVIHRDIESLTK